MKHNPMATANALAVMTVIIFVVCRILVGFFPDLFFTIAQSWFHGITLTPGGTWNLSLLSFILGLVTSTGGAWLAGYIFAAVYNYFVKK